MVDIPIINRKFRELNPLLLGWEECLPNHSYGPHVRDYYLIHYIQSGKGVFYNDSGVHPVEAGQIFIIYPGQVTTYTADIKEPWSYIWIGFDGRLSENLKFLKKCVITYTADHFTKLYRAREIKNTREEYVAGQLFSIFSELLNKESASPSYEQQVADYIRANYMREIHVEDIAKMVGLDRRYLTRIFKVYEGMSIQEFLIKTRLEHAAKYLREGESVTSAASLSGYTDIFHFSKMFKKKYMASPLQYRQKNLMQ